MNKKHASATHQIELGTIASPKPDSCAPAAVTVSIRSPKIRQLDDHSLQEDPELLSLAEDFRHALAKHLRSPDRVFAVVGEHERYKFQVALDSSGSCLTDVQQMMESVAADLASWRGRIESNARNGINAAASEMNFPSTLIPVFKALLRIDQSGGQVFFNGPSQPNGLAIDDEASEPAEAEQSFRSVDPRSGVNAQRIPAPSPEALASIAKEPTPPRLVTGLVTGLCRVGQKLALLLENTKPLIVDGLTSAEAYRMFESGASIMGQVVLEDGAEVLQTWQVQEALWPHADSETVGA